MYGVVREPGGVLDPIGHLGVKRCSAGIGCGDADFSLRHVPFVCGVQNT